MWRSGEECSPVMAVIVFRNKQQNLKNTHRSLYLDLEIFIPWIPGQPYVPLSVVVVVVVVFLFVFFVCFFCFFFVLYLFSICSALTAWKSFVMVTTP